MSEEIWLIVPSMPWLYASSLGRIKAADFSGPVPNGGRRIYRGTPWVGAWDGKRYVAHFRGKTYKVSRLVCEAFHGEAPSDKPVCMHLDEDSRNNRPENLAWGTQKENLNAPGFIAYTKTRTGENNPAVKGRRRKAQSVAA